MLRAFLEMARGSTLARNTLWMLLGQWARLPVQALYFVLIARSLGARGYGAFVGVTALVAVLAPFSGLGSGNILVKNVSRDEECFARYWGKALALTGVSGTLLLLLVLLLSRFLLPATIPFALVCCVSLADLLCARYLDLATQAYQAYQRLGRTSQLAFLPFLVRLVAVAVLFFAGRAASPLLWGYYYLAANALSALVALLWVRRELGAPAFEKRMLWSDLKEGIYFSISTSSLNIYNDIDKSLLARLATLEAVGIYGAAYRIVDVAFTPVRSLLYACYARFFQSGRGGMAGAAGFAAKVLPYAAGYGLFSSVCLYAAAPLLPLVLGPGYAQTVVALRWLSLLPLLKSFHNFMADALTGAGFQGTRSACQVVTALFNVGLILWLIPSFSWRGAAWASLASDGFLALSLWLAILRAKKTESASQARKPSRVGAAAN